MNHLNQSPQLEEGSIGSSLITVELQTNSYLHYTAIFPRVNCFVQPGHSRGSDGQTKSPNGTAVRHTPVNDGTPGDTARERER
ncbi:hypothetical protein CEE69_23555 [Rhodopirellula bahusiensis]|uniref:Uncharacterized protein n=1 Tax=Rhodopirellula bahusiensis TaxID=2014065 RepID=A0A2G1W1M7_9BACT|nr:hypothetical protein CEE69_23555 [Rhodopirellula bahusiensis]